MNVKELRSRLDPKNTQHQALSKVLSSVQVLRGEDGYTPVKGKDYFTPAEIQELFNVIEAKMRTFERGLKGDRGVQGEKGDRGAQGTQGEEGYTPLKGIDYYTEQEKIDIIKQIMLLIPLPKDGESPKIKDVVDEVLKKLKLPSAENLVSKTELIDFLKRGGYRGGGISSVTTDATLSGEGTPSSPLTVVSSGGYSILTATGTIDDTNTSFTFVSRPTEIVINGASYIENDGWTWAVLTATLDFPVGTGGKIYGRS